MSLACALALLVLACASSTKNPYPPFDGAWLYDYGALSNSDANLPTDFGEAISRLDREGRSEQHKQLETIAMSLRPPELLRIEYLSSVMVIRGGGGFRRDYELSNLNPSPGVEVKWDMVTLESKLTADSIQVTEKYELSPDRNRLFITITMDSELLEKPLAMRWTYMAASTF
jgi:hypothetical protein